jgi:1-pyrroline-5-carboxylate dehydrogenase
MPGLPPFKNEPLTDYNNPENVHAMKAALKTARAKYGTEYPLIINGDRITTDDWIESLDPADHKLVIGKVAAATKEIAAKAVDSAYEKFEWWKHFDPEARGRILIKAGAIMRRRKHEVNATMVLEAGKNWVEADADTAEAIDFLEFYGREIFRYSEPQGITPHAGEENEVKYIPLGPAAVIPPWNFPVAILTGMTSAALVAGNTVVLKPASVTPVLGALIYEIFEQAGLPPGVLQFLPGSGGKVGDTIVGHPRTRMIAFTGSKEVGLHINELAAKIADGQIWIKRVIAEMGGKDCIVVDRDCDIQGAIDAIWVSAFGYQGQKCSACSRAILHKDIHDEVVKGVIEKARWIIDGHIGHPAEKETYLGPVSSAQAFHTITEYIEVGKSEAHLAIGGGSNDSVGYFIDPTIFTDVDIHARISMEEIFGPVLSVIKCDDFIDGIEKANNSIYGLTGSVISNNRVNLEYARRHFHVGNLYFNRKCTGALVDVQPFGGFNMSGTDSKAGGRDYLLLFMQAKTVCERF